MIYKSTGHSEKQQMYKKAFKKLRKKKLRFFGQIAVNNSAVFSSAGLSPAVFSSLKVIAKDELRIGKSVPFKAIYIVQYCHVECAFVSFWRARLTAIAITISNELDGFCNVNGQDQSRISELIEMENTRETATADFSRK